MTNNPSTPRELSPRGKLRAILAHRQLKLALGRAPRLGDAMDGGTRVSHDMEELSAQAGL